MALFSQLTSLCLETLTDSLNFMTTIARLYER